MEKKWMMLSLCTLVLFGCSSHASSVSSLSSSSVSESSSSVSSSEEVSTVEDYEMEQTYKAYSNDEIKKDGRLQAITFNYYPASGSYQYKDNYYRQDKIAIVCPGGGYQAVSVTNEGEDYCLELNSYGYTAFYVKYRVGSEYDGTPFRPQRDLARAIKTISENQSTFGITMEDYALIGSSAGGNLVTSFVVDGVQEKAEYQDWNLPMPSTLLLAYPWVNCDGMEKSSSNGLNFVCGDDLPNENSALLSTYNQITDDYPATYLFWGDADELVDPETNEKYFIENLKVHQIRYDYDEYEGISHGVGLAKKTVAEDWFSHAMEFWNNDSED